MSTPRTLYDKLVDSHTVATLDEAGDTLLLYVDRSILNEYTSPQAFTALREAGRAVRRSEALIGVVDHVNSTDPDRRRTADLQIDYFTRNCRDFGIELLGLLHPMQGIEHVVAPEIGLIMPGMVVAAGDSHTTTYGAFGALGFGIGTSDIEHMLATQTLVYRRLRSMLVQVVGRLGIGVTAKDLIMALIRQIGADGAAGHAIEFSGEVIDAMGMEGRMTICNMVVECGARSALMAPDQTVFDYVAGRPRAPAGALWRRALAAWRDLRGDPGAVFDQTIVLDADQVAPMVSWGTSPDQATSVDGEVPDPAREFAPNRRRDMERALAYMDLAPGTPLESVAIDRAFIGSCTNARIDDLREAAAVLRGRRVAEGVRAMVVPGSSAVRRQAEAEGLADIFKAAGFEWRQSGCSMCLAMNDDVLAPGERCASSTNRNFEGRQGAGGRTHLMSAGMVAAAAVTGRLTDVRRLMETRP